MRPVHIAVLLAALASVSVAPVPGASAASQMQSAPAESTAILAPEGLEARERANLERQYRYQFRNKQRVMSPNLSSELAGDIPTNDVERAETEQERLYRYFGVAMSLRDEGRYEEAIEIMCYLTEKFPHDKYLRNCLDSMRCKGDSARRNWQNDAAGGAHKIKTVKVKNLMDDGMSLYKQKRYDEALICFTDVLALEPDHFQAKVYLDKLKKYYLEEVQIDNTVAEYEKSLISTSTPVKAKRGTVPVPKRHAGSVDAGGAVLQKSAADRLLDDKEDALYKAVPAAQDKARLAKKLLDSQEMDAIISEKRLSCVMDKGEVEERIREIVNRSREERAKTMNVVTLGGGDEIAIVVQDHPELTGKVMLNYMGEIVLPLVNDPVNVRGLTEDEAALKIAETLKKYVADPAVRVVISQYASKMFYVIDDISCTPYPITRPNMTLRDALFVADWGDNKALGRVIVMKPNRGNPIVKKVDCFDMLYRGNLAHNIRIENGDVIYVPLTIAAKTTKVIADTLAPFNQLKAVRDEWIDQRYHRHGWERFFWIPPEGDDQNTLQAFGGNAAVN